jgi:hypothetical protein
MTRKTLTDLYAKGTEVVLKDGTLLWLQKLTPYEQGVVRQKAAVARARTMLALKEVGSDELALLDAQVDALDDGTLVDIVVQSKYGELIQEANAELAIDEDWQERNEIRTSTDRGVLEPGSPEDQLLTKIEQEYTEEVLARANERQARLKERAAAEGRAKNEQAYRDAYIEGAGRQAFIEAMRAADLFYMVRQCRASQVDGRWDHNACDHGKRAFGSVEELQQIPEELDILLREHEAKISMSVDDARSLDRQGSSSASSPLPSAPEASAASSDQTASPTPAGT